MRIVILGGAAQMAQPAVHYLIRKEEVTGIVLADINLSKVKALADSLGDKATAVAVDIKNDSDVCSAIAEAKLVMNFIGPYYRFGTTALEAAIEMGVRYLDICDDYDATAAMLALDKRARERGITAVTGMGASPGVTNVLARLGADSLDYVKEIHTYWVVGDAEPSGFGALVHLFHIIKGKVPTFTEGNLQDVPAYRLQTAKKVDFGGPVGEVTVYHVGHPEPVTLSKYIEGVETVTNYGALLPEYQNPMFKTLVDLGLTSEEPIPFKNGQITPLEFLLTLFQQKQEKTKQKTEQKQRSVGATKIEVIGEKDGKLAQYTFTKSSYDDMANSTSIPAGVVAYLMLTGVINDAGVMAPECIEPKVLLTALNEANYFAEGKGFEVARTIGGETISGAITDMNQFPELW